MEDEMDWNAITPELQKKLDPKHVKPKSANGPKGDYIEGWHAIAEANELFGFGGWSYQVEKLTKEYLEEVEKESYGKTFKQWQAAYTCIVTLQVGDTIREDVGFGSGFGKNIGDAIEGATKEAVTDALKRCLRTFGNRFGLALYDKTRANVGVDHVPLPHDIEPALPDFVEQCRGQHGGGEGFVDYVATTFAAAWKRCKTPKQMQNALDKHRPSLDWLEKQSGQAHDAVIDAYELHMMDITGQFAAEGATQ
jgi:DNA recombination protein Rad52